MVERIAYALRLVLSRGLAEVYSFWETIVYRRARIIAQNADAKRSNPTAVQIK